MKYIDEIKSMIVGRTVADITGTDEYFRFVFDDDSYQEFRIVPGGYITNRSREMEERIARALETIALELEKHSQRLDEMNSRRSILDMVLDKHTTLRMFITEEEARRWKETFDQQHKAE